MIVLNYLKSNIKLFLLRTLDSGRALFSINKPEWKQRESEWLFPISLKYNQVKQLFLFLIYSFKNGVVNEKCLYS